MERSSMQEMNKKASGLAKGSLACGILTIIPFVGLAFSLAAIIMGIVDLVKIKNGKSSASGRKMDIAGIVLGLVLLPIAIFILSIITGIFVMAASTGTFSDIGSSLSSIIKSLFELVKLKLGFSG
jgi:hypothetical protein